MTPIIEQMLTAPLDMASSILPSSGGWSDAVDALSVDSEATIYGPPPTQIYAFIHRRIGHIVANRRNFAVLKESYTYPEKKYREPLVANASVDSARSFVDNLIEIARAERNAIFDNLDLDNAGQSQQLVGRRIVLLHGHRGSGKTFFLNHLLAAFSDHLDTNKTIWIRINMVADFGDSTDILHRIYAQAAKIIMRYYDHRSQLAVKTRPPINVSDALQAFIDTLDDEETRQRYTDSAVGMKQVLYSVTRDDPLTPSLVPLNLGRLIFETAQRAGYSAIVVFDGFDQLEASVFHARRFRNRYEAALRLANDPARLGMAFLFVTRTNTLHTEPDTTAASSAFWATITNRREIAPVPFEKILDNRRDALKREVRALCLANPALGSADELELHIEEFFTFARTTKDASGTYEELFSGFGANRRAQMQVLQLAYFEFLKQKTHRVYLLTEALIKSGQIYPPKPYRYSPAPDGSLDRQGGSDTLFDNHLLPSIFWYPHVEYQQAKGLPEEVQRQLVPPPGAPILGLRLIQLLAAHENRIERGDTADRLSVTEIVELCHVLFGYPKTLVSMLLEEFVEFEFIELLSPDFPAPASHVRLQLKPMPKLSRMLKHFLFDLAYLGLWAMRVPVAATAASPHRAPYFRACTVDLPNPTQRPGDNLREWITTKVLNAVALTRLLQSINEEQERAYEARLGQLSGQLRKTAVAAAESGDKERPGMFKFVRLMKLSVGRAAAAIEDSYDQPDMLRRDYYAYWRAWGPAGRPTGSEQSR